MKIASLQGIRRAERAVFESGETTSSALMDAVVAHMAEVFGDWRPVAGGGLRGAR